MCVPLLALAAVGPGAVDAHSAQTDARVLRALVHVRAREAGLGEREAGQALALEAAVGVGAVAVGAHPGLGTLVMVDTRSVVRTAGNRYQTWII